MRNNKGITLSALIITVVVLVIISATTLYTITEKPNTEELNHMYADIENLNNKVITYYTQYNKLPIIGDVIISVPEDMEKSANDNGNYYKIDLTKLENVSLHFGKENEEDDYYIVNEQSHSVYYFKGIEYDGKTYYTKQVETEQVSIEKWENAKRKYDGNGKFYALPNGFYYVGGTVDSGIVISDNQADENRYEGKEDVGKDLIGNQYVWVPADGVNLKYQKHEYDTKEVNDTSSTPDTGNGNWRTYYYRMYTDWTDSGANAESVAKYGGFYIGRYEAGYEEVTDGSTYKVGANKNTQSGVPLSKAGVACWNYISQINSKKIAQNLSYESVTSNLIDGNAWDTVMDWFTADGVNVNSSTSWGNHIDNRSTVPAGTIYAIQIYRSVKSGQTGSAAWLVASRYKEAETSFAAGGGTSITTLEGLQEYINVTEIDTTTYSYTTRLELTTGAVEDYKVKNIYDMAGNMYEWTTEEGKHNATSSVAVLRGGSFNSSGTTDPACYRHGNGGVGANFNIGFRVSLYINL